MSLIQKAKLFAGIVFFVVAGIFPIIPLLEIARGELHWSIVGTFARAGLVGFVPALLTYILTLSLSRSPPKLLPPLKPKLPLYFPPEPKPHRPHVDCRQNGTIGKAKNRNTDNKDFG
jgi:hypothetical protein